MTVSVLPVALAPWTNGNDLTAGTQSAPSPATTTRVPCPVENRHPPARRSPESPVPRHDYPRPLPEQLGAQVGLRVEAQESPLEDADQVTQLVGVGQVVRRQEDRPPLGAQFPHEIA